MDAMRIGLGHDTHRLGPGGPLRLGGIDLAADRHSIGYSDADTLLHAVTDALLGAAALGDIGQIFSDGDPANRGRDSAEMLRIAYGKVQAAGWRIANLDCVVFLEAPKLAPHRDAILRRLADILGLETNAIGLKAKSGEGVGTVGRGECVAAECIALLVAAPRSGP